MYAGTKITVNSNGSLKVEAILKLLMYRATPMAYRAEHWCRFAGVVFLRTNLFVTARTKGIWSMRQRLLICHPVRVRLFETS